MDAAYEAALRAALARALVEIDRLERALAGAEARAAQALAILDHLGAHKPGHDRLLERVDLQAQGKIEPRVRLRQYVENKRALVGPAIDCAARLHLCKARCCALEFELTPEDVTENQARWQPDRPFVIQQGDDGYCAHFDRGGTGCTIYFDRPATCRTYTCEHDPKVWLDFDRMIPAPWSPRG